MATGTTVAIPEDERTVVPACPDWCELPAGHPRTRVGDRWSREHRRELAVPPSTVRGLRHYVSAVEVDQMMTRPVGLVTCDCGGPWKPRDETAVPWRRPGRSLVLAGVLADLCSDCEDFRYRGDMQVLLVEVSRVQRGGPLRDVREVTFSVLLVSDGGTAAGSDYYLYGDGDTFEVTPAGVLEVTHADGTGRTYAPGAWLHVDRLTAAS